MNKMKSTIIVTLVTAFIAGCAKEPPKCSDEDTFSLIRQIIVEQLGGREGVSDKELQDNMKIEFPRASAFDEKIKKYSCEAKLIAGGTVELPITYESQLDDKNQHIVSVGGIARGDLMTLQYAIAEGIKKGRAAKERSASPSTGSTPQAQTTYEQRIPSAASTGASIEIDIKNEIDLKDGTYLAKEYGGQGRYAFITHSHGRFEGGDIAEAVCTDGFSVTNLPDKFDRIKEVLKPTDFVLTKCDEAK